MNLDAGRLSVRGTLKVAKGRVYVDPPKTKKGRRTMTMPAAAIAVLQKHRPLEAAEGDWIFKDVDGGPLRAPNVRERSLCRILAKAGLPHIAFHELRHTHASLLASAPGLNPKIVQERLGHASIGMTLDTYSHLFEGADAEAVAALDTLDLVRS